MSALPDRAAWYYGGKATCVIRPPKPQEVYRLVLLGPPGSGKATQASMLEQRVGACHLSARDALVSGRRFGGGRADKALETARRQVRCGKTIPDEIAAALLRERSHCLNCYSGAILDGFPQTVGQAKELSKLMDEASVSLTAVIHYDVNLNQIVARLTGRLACAMCKAIYHSQLRPPETEGVCDRCGFRLARREEDRPAVIRSRVRAYRQSVAPLLDYYSKRGLLVTVDADAAPDVVCDRTLVALLNRASTTLCV